MKIKVMLKSCKLLVLGFSVTVVSGVSSCSHSTTPSTLSNSEAKLVVDVTPTDGATGVDLQSSISIIFNQPMDTSAVSENIHLMGGAEMREWMNSEVELGFKHMSDSRFTEMMQELDSLDLSGTILWSAGLKGCEFVPKSSFASHEEYMLIMYEDGMMNKFMLSMGMMGGNKNVLMYHFETVGD